MFYLEDICEGEPPNFTGRFHIGDYLQVFPILMRIG